MKAPRVVLVPLLEMFLFLLVAAICCCCRCSARPLDGKIETILSCANKQRQQQLLKEQQQQQSAEPSSLARLRLSKFHDSRIKGLGGSSSQDGIIVPIVDGITTGGGRDNNMMMRMRMKATRGGGMMMMMKTSTPTSVPTVAPTGEPTDDAPTPVPTAVPTAMPTMIPECTSVEILYRVSELQTGMNETTVGNTLTFDVYHPETLEVVGKYTDAATTVGPGGDDCIYVGSYAFYDDDDDNTSTFDSQITLLATCSSAVNAITGGTGRYACVKGVEEFPNGDVSTYPEGYFGSMLHLCGGTCNRPARRY